MAFLVMVLAVLVAVVTFSLNAEPSVITMIWFLPVSWLIGPPAGFVLYLLLNRRRAA